MTGSSWTCSRRGNTSLRRPRSCLQAVLCCYVATTTSSHRPSRRCGYTRLHRAGGLGVAGAVLACPRTGGAAGTRWSATWIPDHDPAAGAGFTAPVRKRRPAPGAYGENYTGQDQRPAGFPSGGASWSTTDHRTRSATPCRRSRALQDEVDRLREAGDLVPPTSPCWNVGWPTPARDARTTAANNERLAATLRRGAGPNRLAEVRVDRLAQPPATFAVFLASAGPHRYIYTTGRKMRVSVSPMSTSRPWARSGGDDQRGDERRRRCSISTRSARWCCSRSCSTSNSERLVVGHGDEEERRPAGQPAARTSASGDSADRPPGALRLRAGAEA